MNFEAKKIYINLLLDHIFDLLFVNKFGVNHAEHIFNKILEILDEDQDIKNWFFILVRENLMSDEYDATKYKTRPERFVDPDLILFLAHATRWNEFEKIAKDRNEKLSSLKLINTDKEFSTLIIEALKDDWDDRDFYQKFSSKQKS